MHPRNPRHPSGLSRGIGRPRKSRAACRHVTVARSRLRGAHPKRKEPARSQKEAEANALAGKPGKISVLGPGHGLECLVLADGDAACSCKRLDYFTLFIQDFD